MAHEGRAAWRDGIKASELKPSTRLVALILADYWPTIGPPVVWVEQVRIMRESGLSERAVRNSVRELAEEGWLHQIEPPRQHRCPRFQLTNPRGATVAPLDSRGAHGAARGATVAARGAPRAPESTRTTRDHSGAAADLSPRPDGWADAVRKQVRRAEG